MRYDINFWNPYIIPYFLSGEGEINLADAIMALQILIDTETANPAYVTSDVNQDNLIGIEKFIFIMQALTDLR